MNYPPKNILRLANSQLHGLFVLISVLFSIVSASAELRITSWGESSSDSQLGRNYREKVQITENGQTYTANIEAFDEYTRATTKISDEGIEQDVEFAWGIPIADNQWASSNITIDFELTEPMYYDFSGEVLFNDPYGSVTTFQATLIGGWESFSSIQTSRGNIQPDKYVLGEQRGTRENTLNGASRGVLYAGMYRLRLYTSSSDYGDGDSNQIVADQMNENYQGLITGSSKIKLNLSPIPVDAKPVIEIDPIYYSLANEAITINASPIEGYPEFEFEFEWYFNGEQIEQDRTKNPAFLTIDGTKASVGEYRVVVYSNFETKTEKTFEYRNSPDTDGDGLSDYFEQSVFGSDFEKFDSDGDGLSDFEENELRSNPLSSDSDDDGLLDNDEVTITFTRPSRSDTDRNGIDDGAEDFDDDGLDNLSEINNHSTNPFKGDTDSDTILDSVELELGYDPINFTITEDVLFNHEMITIDDPNNQPDANGFGSVDYVYRISKHEISRQMIDSYNSQNSIKIRLPVFETYTAYNDPKKPITDISWNEAARFVNWLNVAKGYPIAYKFKSAGPNSDISLWVPSDEGYDETNPYRNRNAYYFLPSEDEWYKAAFYDPSTNDNQGGYWLFATGSNDAPIALNESSDQNTAIYGLTRRAGPADTIKAGGLSPFGTMAQSGNAAEWCESAFEFPNNSVTKYRVWRGGSLGSLSSSAISSAFRNSAPATGTNGPNMGFRVASKSNDRDNDGLIDSVETNTGIYVSELDTGTDPDVADSDADGLIDSVETNTGVFVDSSNTGTSPHIFDTNQNGNSDGFDVENDIDPTSPLTTIVVLDNFYESVSGQDLIIDATPKVGFPSPTTFQWYLNDIPIEASSGGTENFLTFSGDLADEGTWKVVVTSVGGSTEQTFEYRIFSDTDNDGVSDYRETNFFGTKPDIGDTDGDGLIDGEEINIHKTDPNKIDTDSDGFTDLYEIETSYDPNSAESVPDALVNIITAIEVKFNAALGATYAIEFSTDNQNWDVIENAIVGGGGAVERLYSKQEYPTGFFRVERKD